MATLESTNREVLEAAEHSLMISRALVAAGATSYVVFINLNAEPAFAADVRDSTGRGGGDGSGENATSPDAGGGTDGKDSLPGEDGEPSAPGEAGGDAVGEEDGEDGTSSADAKDAEDSEDAQGGTSGENSDSTVGPSGNGEAGKDSTPPSANSFQLEAPTDPSNIADEINAAFEAAPSPATPQAISKSITSGTATKQADTESAANNSVGGSISEDTLANIPHFTLTESQQAHQIIEQQRPESGLSPGEGALVLGGIVLLGVGRVAWKHWFYSNWLRHQR